MTDKERLIEESLGSKEAFNINSRGDTKIPWYFAGGFLLFWGLLFFAVVIPFFYRLPTALTIEDAGDNVFITERAYKNLYGLSNIGTKWTGTNENEILAVDYILRELEKIKEQMLIDVFDIDINLSQVSGMFAIKAFLRKYQGVQNIAVKLSPKNSTSETYLLVNSHFDSQPATPAAGDAGFMIVVMLEVLRVMATTRQTFEHPVVFLFNGAEESGLSASHGFITQHKWAPNCKAVVNLDAGGSGSREVLFQSGPNHPWLVKYYARFIKYPFATTLAEEMFQAGIIPSETDFRQFKNFGKIPGLDMAQCANGFIYHTKYDTIDIIPREALQNTGDNILNLVRGLANATELYNTEAHQAGHAVFFDFLGLYFFHYSESTGKLINFTVAMTTLILIFISMWRIATVCRISVNSILGAFILALIVQIISFVLGLTLPIVVAYVYDSMGLSLVYYSTPLLIIGLYVCPSLIGLALPITLYHSLPKNDKISSPYNLQLSLHSQASIFAALSIGLTLLDIRSSYIFMIPLMFYVISLTFNLMTILHDLGYAWTGLLKLSQVIPFLYSSYLFYFLIVVLAPMNGRSGGSSNRDIFIAVFAAMGTILSFGFLIPLINTFRRPGLVILGLIVVSALFMSLATYTQIGFPYRPKTNGHRVTYMHVRNKFYEYDGTLAKDESGYLFNFMDRRMEKPLLGTKVNLTGLERISSSCEKHMMCGMPLYNTRCALYPAECAWLPRSEPIEPPGSLKLVMLSKTIINLETVRFEFNLTGPADMRLFIQPYEDVTITKWSFLDYYLQNPPRSPLPYLIYLKYGNDTTTSNFHMEFKKPGSNFNVPIFQLGVGGHFICYEIDELSKQMAASFPTFSILSQWPALYERYIF